MYVASYIYKPTCYLYNHRQYFVFFKKKFNISNDFKLYFTDTGPRRGVPDGTVEMEIERRQRILF